MIDMSEEIWKPIVDYEGLYEVSNYGRVKSLPHHTRGVVEWRKGRILRNGSTKNGFEFVSLSKNGIQTTLYIANLVAEAFIPNKEGHNKVTHIDRDTHNNRADNLMWYTHV